MALDISEVYEQHEKFNEKQWSKIRKAARGKLADIQDLVSSYANDDGKIDRRRKNKLIRELDDIEQDIRDETMSAFEEFTDDTAEWSAKKLAAVIGVAASADLVSDVKKKVNKNVIRRKGDDDLKLKDRVWSASADVRDSTAREIRKSVIRGEPATKIIPRIRDEYDGELWKIQRMVRTEGPAAFRSAVIATAGRGGREGWVRFHEGTCDRPDHPSHKCYELQREDRYGKGEGIFKASDSDIIVPHPNCTSWVVYLEDEGSDA